MDQNDQNQNPRSTATPQFDAKLAGADEKSARDATAGGSIRPSTLDEALRVLDDAIATGPSSLRDLVTEEYDNLKEAISDFVPEVGETLRGASQEAYGRVADFTQDLAARGQAYAQRGAARGRVMASDMDQKVRSNPWPVLAGVAIGTFALGYLLGTRSEAHLTASVDREDTDQHDLASENTSAEMTPTPRRRRTPRTSKRSIAIEDDEIADSADSTSAKSSK